MNFNRVQPLILIMALGCLVLLVRLYQVQVNEHDIWAQEALGLTYQGHEIPYKRGSIKDTHGNILARSKSTNHVALRYRDFRREHYLGQLAHARSLMEGRAVGLPEARWNRERWALELLELTPAELELYAKGKPVRLGSLEYPELKNPRSENRARRAKDIGFYARYLLNLDKEARGKLEKLARDEGKQRSYLELSTQVQQQQALRQGAPGPADAEAVWAALWERIERYDQRLVQLARLLFDGDQLEPGQEPVEALVLELESLRRLVENQTASKLFSEAAQFVAGRIEPSTLVEHVELEWIAKLLAWDAERLMSWARSARRHWRQSWLQGYALPRLCVQLQLSQRPDGALPDDFLSRMAGVFRQGDVVRLALDQKLPSWRDPGPELVVLGGLGALFDAELPELPGIGPEVLPFQDPELIAELAPGTRDWSILDAFWEPELISLEGERPREASGQNLGRWITEGRFRDDLYLSRASEAMLLQWDARLQDQLELRLSYLRESLKPARLSPGGRLVMRADWRERAAERAEYFLKDYGQRSRSLIKGEPEYEVIYRLSRYEKDYPGFFAREAPKREYLVLEGDQARLAPQLIGGVSSVSIKRLVGQHRAAQAMARLKANPSKSQEEQEQLADLVGFVELPDAVRGYEGVEGYWNEELSGRNGFREVHGLDSLSEGRSTAMEVRKRENGLDLTLTLDSVLQRAAQATLRDPFDGHDPEADLEWYREPVGAVVLLSKQGDLLAAVSEPDEVSRDPNALRRERQASRERTFRAPTFQPPGSVFKPFVAAYVLSKLNYDASIAIECGLNNKGHAGYKDVDCHSTSGHGTIPLYDALIHSCNAYFACLGEGLSDAQLRDVVSTFGFDQGSGIKSQVSSLGRRGFVEDAGGITAVELLPRGGLSAHQRMMVGNGLAEMVATPVQLARATLALAEGQLPDLRLVRRIGDEEQPLGARRPLNIDQPALEAIRHAMRGVATDGSAKRALAPEVLGLDVAAKTGSADLVGGGKDEFGRRIKVRKHTWVIGWLPYEDPELVFVVFVHDTRQTSSHGAIYVAQQLLQQPALLDWLDQRGVDTQAARRLGAPGR